MTTINKLNRVVRFFTVDDTLRACNELFEVLITTQNIDIVARGNKYGFIHTAERARFVYNPVEGKIIAEQGGTRRVFRLTEVEDFMVQGTLREVLGLAGFFDRLERVE